MATPSVDLVGTEFWTQPADERDAVFAALRAAEEPLFCPVPNAPGFYALTRYDEVATVSRNPGLFSSEPSAGSLEDLPPEAMEYLESMINMDDPRHARMRRIVARAFTPRMIERAVVDVGKIATRTVDELVEQGPDDFVRQVATPMPLEVICAMMGIPRDRWPEVVEITNVIIYSLTDPDYAPQSGVPRELATVQALQRMFDLMAELAEQRRAHPTDDVITALVTANIDGEALDDRELGGFFSLLVVGGNETTRNALSHALVLFTEHPEQRELLRSDLAARLPGAVEEVIRHATPINWMRRNVTREVELRGHTYQAGDRVVMFYRSANRDESVFTNPSRFDITRSPNPHVSFGAPGPHFCLGAHLARREVRVMLQELFTRLPGIRATAPPVRTASNLVNSIAALPFTF